MTEAPSSDRPSTLKFGLLGPLTVTRDESAVALGGRQQRAVLAVLLIEAGSVVSVARLADCVWGEQTPAAATTTVQAYISRLRERLDPERVRGSAGRVLVTEPGGYRLVVEDSDVDASVFESRVRSARTLYEQGRLADCSAELSDALDQWRGPVLADLAGYDFIAMPSARLEELRLAAYELRIDADLALGREQDVIGELDRLVDAHPLRERLHSQRMLALYRCGRQSDALAAYRKLRETLSDELGIDPSPPVQRLHESILNQDPGLDLVPVPPPAEPPIPAADVGTAADAAPAATPAVAAAPAVVAPARRRATRRRRAVTVAVASTVAVLVATATVAFVHESDIATLAAFPANAVGRLDGNGGLRDAVAIGQSPTGVAYGDGSVWVTNTGSGSVSRIDPDRHIVIGQIPVGRNPDGIAITGNDVWVVNGGDGTVSRINVHAGSTVGQTIRVGAQPGAITATADGVYVANRADDTIQRIDPASGHADPAIAVGGQPAGLAASGRTVWVTNAQDGTVSRVDTVTHGVDDPIRVGSGPKGIAVTDDAVWVANSLDQTVSRIDPIPGGRVVSLPVGDGPNSIVANSEAVWVSNEFDGTVTRLDPNGRSAPRRVAIGTSPRGLLLIGDSVWVATGSFAGVEHRGGTLRVEMPLIPELNKDPDPASSYELTSLALIYDGLVAQRYVGGTAGLTLVPNLAVRLPTPTAEGRVYTFTLRSGIRYSDRTEVQPDDIRRGIQRALVAGTGRDYFLGILGAETCTKDHSIACEIERGISTNAATRQITITLKAADPDFLYKLSVFAVATPPGVPVDPVSTPFPGTGPYLISGFVANNEDRLTLSRNTQFHQWSFAARPNGYPDVIQWKRVDDSATRVADVQTGRADLMEFGADSAPATDLQLRFPERMHEDFNIATYFEFLNQNVPPFDKIEARQAVNLAVDRNEVARLFGSSQARLSCQVFTPNFPGYQKYCPWTSKPTVDGEYHGPDLVRAKALVTASGTLGAKVTVRSPDFPLFVKAGTYYAQVLRTLGYVVPPLVIMEHNAYFEYINDSRHHPQVGGGAWLLDFAAPSNFWQQVLSCRSSRHWPTINVNWSEFCDAAIDELAERASALQLTNPAKARAIWTQVDHRLTDAAPWILGPAQVGSAFVSPRIGNYQTHPIYGPMLDQMWVQG